MPVVMLIALVFSIGLLLFAMPIIVYVAPLIVVGCARRVIGRRCEKPWARPAKSCTLRSATC